MSELSIFEGNSLVSSDLFKSLQNAGNNLLGGSGGGMRRISVRGKRFRELVGSEEMRVSKSDSMNIVIVSTRPRFRVPTMRVLTALTNRLLRTAGRRIPTCRPPMYQKISVWPPAAWTAR
jgi:hypothetical protein